MPLRSLLVVGIFLAAAAGLTSAQCLVSNTTPGFLLPYENIPGYGMCARGFLCPNSDPSNASTYPRVCPPTPECLQLRLQHKFCEPQGIYEPYPCPAGYYCPTGSQQILCPQGHFCPVASTSPYHCPPIADCPAGSIRSKDFGPLVLIGLLDAAALIVAVVRRLRKRLAIRPSPPAVAHPSSSDHSEDMRAIPSSPAAASSHAPTAAERILCECIRRRRGAPMPAMEFRFSNLSVTIPAKDGAEPKTVLQRVDGSLQPGRVTAILGGSGAGKTVFFSALLSKLDSTWERTGSLSINGEGPEQFERFRHVIGFVPQDDVLHEELSVADNAWYASEIRLPREWTPAEREACRTAAMDIAGVSHFKDKVVSSLSLSERKRVGIAVELASAPASLFLDEATSTLDATAALNLCLALTSLARASNMTIVMVIHQPRFEIWNGLDHVLFLAPGGFTVFQGTKAESEAYFTERLGFALHEGNPADVIVDGIAANRDRCITEWEHAQHAQQQQHHHHHQQQHLPAQRLSFSDSGSTVVPASRQHALLALEHPSSPFPLPNESASFWRQVELSHRRSLAKQATMIGSMTLDVLLGMVAASIMAAAAVQTSYVGMLRGAYVVLGPQHIGYLLSMIMMFYAIAIASTTPATSLRAFLQEREVYWKEMSTGGHSRLAYYIGTCGSELYRLVFGALHFAMVAYYMFGPLQTFWEFFAVILLCFLCCDAQSSALSMVLRPSAAPLLVTVAGVFVSLLNGYPTIPLLMYLGYPFYLTEAFADQEIRYLNDLYNEPLFDRYSTTRYAPDYVIVVSIFLIYRVAGFLFMKHLNQDKQR